MRSHRVPILLFFVFGFTVVAKGQISLSVSNAPIDKVFALIEQQSGYNFLYTGEIMARAKPVTVTLRDASLNDALRACFAEQPLQYTIDDKHILVRLKAAVVVPAPVDRMLRGKIVNAAGEGIAGVSVAVKGTNLITATNTHGGFMFDKVPDAVVLVISGAEMERQEIVVGARSYVEVSVREHVNVLDETVVIAYGTTSRRYATGSVSSVRSDEIGKQPVANVLSVLAGRVPGLQVTQVSGVPGTYIKMQLRGINSIASGNDPLFVIDGIPFPSQPLNGAIGGGATVAASPLNSVNPADIASIEILKDADATAIFGSRGANGVILITTKKAKGQETLVNFRTSAGKGKVTRMMDLMDNPEYIAMRREAFRNDGFTPNTTSARDFLLWDTTRYTDWQNVLIGNSSSYYDGQVSVSGGTEHTQFLFNAGYHKETSVFPGSFGEDRKSFSMSGSHQSENARFKIAVTSFFSRYYNRLPQQDLYNAIVLPPTAPAIYKADGSLNWENSTWSNPLARIYATFATTTDNLNSNFNLSYQIFPALQFRFSGGANYILSRDNLVLPAASRNPAFGIPSSASFGDKTIFTLIGEPQLEYKLQKGAHSISILAGATLQQTKQNSIYQAGNGYSSDALLKSLQAASVVTILSEEDLTYRYSGAFARLQYDYAKKYLLSLTGRRDGSSRFGEESRMANFGSAGAAWIFSQEGFAKEWEWLSFGKLKASAGVTGNDQIGDYRFLSLYSPSSYPYLGVTTFAPSQLNNPNYRWEKVDKLEAGADFGFLKGRLYASVNYYHNTTRNQLVSYPLPAQTGFAGVLQNLPALIRNTGWEIELSAEPLRSRKLVWKTSFNVTIPRTKLISFDQLENSPYSYQYKAGYPLTIAQTFRYLGVDPAKGIYVFEDYNKDGVISDPEDRMHVLNTGIQYFGGWRNSISAGPFSIQVLLQFSRRLHAENYLYTFNRPGTMQNQPRFVLDRWQRPNEGGQYQRFAVSNAAANPAFTNYQFSDEAYTNASYLRLRNVSIACDLRSIIKDKKWIRQLLVFTEANNLATITSYKGLDPENASQLVPPIRMIVFGIQCSF